MKIKSPTDLLFDQLADLYSVEEQLIDALPDLAEKVRHPGLKALLERHGTETNSHLTGLAKVFERHGRSPGSETCKAMAGLLKGGNGHLKKASIPEVRDLMMIAHCLRIEQYEVVGYRMSLFLATNLSIFQDIAEVLETTLVEETEAREGLDRLKDELFALAGAQ